MCLPGAEKTSAQEHKYITAPVLRLNNTSTFPDGRFYFGLCITLMFVSYERSTTSSILSKL